MTKQKPECIYIVSRLTGNPIDYLTNMRQTFKAAAELWRRGHYPFVPALDYQIYIELDGEYGLGGRSPYPASLEWMRRCDSVLMLNGYTIDKAIHINIITFDSKGAEGEYEEAVRVGKKIYWNINDVPPVGAIVGSDIVE